MPRTLRAVAPPDCATTLCAARCVHDDGDADQADEGSGDVPSVWPESVEGHAPGEGSGDEDAAVGGKDPAEVCVGLQRRDEAVDAERDDAGDHPDPAAVFTHALPDQPRATDFSDPGQDEQQDGTRHGP